MTAEERKAYNRRYYLAHKAQIVAQHREYRATDDGKAMRRKEKANRKKRHPEKVRSEWAKYEKSATRLAYMEQTRESRKGKCRLYWQKNRDRLIAQGREWNRVHREEQLARRSANRERENEWHRQWKRNNPDAYRVIAARKFHKRRCLKKQFSVGSDPKATAKRIADIKLPASMPCHWCGRETTRERRHIDHIIPLNKGGAHAAENLCCACPRCNCSKQDKLPHEFKPHPVA